MNQPITVKQRMSFPTEHITQFCSQKQALARFFAPFHCALAFFVSCVV
jgi:hypothetical protein